MPDRLKWASKRISGAAACVVKARGVTCCATNTSGSAHWRQIKDVSCMLTFSLLQLAALTSTLLSGGNRYLFGNQLTSLGVNVFEKNTALTDLYVPSTGIES